MDATNEKEPVYPDWQQRMLEERLQLFDRISSINAFLEDPTKRLANKEWVLLKKQRSAMISYLFALNARCDYYHLPQLDPGVTSLFLSDLD